MLAKDVVNVLLNEVDLSECGVYNVTSGGFETVVIVTDRPLAEPVRKILDDCSAVEFAQSSVGNSNARIYQFKPARRSYTNPRKRIQIPIKLDAVLDRDILEYLNSLDNVQGTIKQLLRDQIRKGGLKNE